MIQELAQSPLFGLSLSVGAFALGSWVHQKLRTPLANPLLIAIAAVIAVLKLLDIPLEAYNQGGRVISLFLAPATAALAYTIYSQFSLLRRHLLPVLAGCAAGSAASMGSVYLLCRLFGLDQALTLSLLPKSVTTPIAMSVSEQLGGVPSVTVAAVLVTGMLGNILAPYLVRLFHVRDEVAAGIGIGACSHAIGTSKALELGQVQGAMSGVAIGVSGLVTVLIAMAVA